MKHSKTAILSGVFSIALITGCTPEETLINKVGAGKLISSKEITTSFNDIVRSNVVTTKGSFSVRGLVSGINNSEVTIQTYDSGSYLCITGNRKCQRIYGM